MPSQLSWLDYSPSEQKRVRELLRLFEDVDTRDELGTGQVRDAFSDLLFPGMSVLLTRARYLLFVPWCYPVPDGANIEKVRGVGDRNERRLIVAMHNQGDRDGLIGGRAGTAVKILPSTIYGTALRTFGIQQAELGDLPASLDAAADEATELTGRRAGYWHRSVPPAPTGFPSAVEGGFELTSHEAEFLRARVAGGAAGRYLAHIVTDTTDDLIGNAPWSDPSAASASAAIREDLRLAEDFAIVHHGAALLYNLVVAERYEAEGLTQVADPVDLYRAALDAWADQLAEHRTPATWDEIKIAAARINPRIAPNDRLDRYLRAWFAFCEETGGRGLADDDRARRLVGDRELLVKRAQSRLTNDKLLQAWSGASGSGRYDYRWQQVRRVVNDIRVGLREDADAAA